MKNFITKSAAAISAVVISACAAFSYMPAVSAYEEVKVSFDCFSDDISFVGKTDPANFEAKGVTAGYIIIPDGKIDKDGYSFEGWTVDGKAGYTAGDFYRLPEEGGEVVFEPVWSDAADANKYNIFYTIDIDGIERPEDLKDWKMKANSVVALNMLSIDGGKIYSIGWTDGENTYTGSDKFIMPAKDLTLTPVWRHVIDIKFVTGDVDRINGMTEFVTVGKEDTKTETSASNRFSRNGFEIVGWTSSVDGQVYQPLQTFICPAEDVVFTAVWAPKTYKVVFNAGTGNSADNQRVEGKTDEAIIAPEMIASKDGYVFAGWKDKNGDIYQPGEEYIVPGAIPGSGISLSAVWNQEGQLPAVTTTAPATAAVTTTTTSASTAAVTDTTASSTAAPASETTAASTNAATTSSSAADTPVSTTTSAPAAEKIAYGDANEDGVVTLADCLAILQFVANEDKYPLSDQGKKNADCFNPGDGITANDAVAVVRFDTKVVDKLPVIEK